MKCECCDKLLTDKEATARFVPDTKDDPPRYVGMCKACQEFLPSNIRIITRPDLEDTLPDEDGLNDSIEWNADDYGYEE
jgi:hypothetical protein